MLRAKYIIKDLRNHITSIAFSYINHSRYRIQMLQIQNKEQNKRNILNIDEFSLILC